MRALLRELRFTGEGTVLERLRAAAKKLVSRPPALEPDAVAGPDVPGVEVWSAVELLSPLAERCGAEVERFVTEVGVGAEVDTLDPRADAVSLLTLHAAKGLEFPVVFLTGCEDGLLPLRFGGGTDDAQLAEERRLFFVGLTRAQDQLFLSHAAERARHGSARETTPSPFLAAIGDAVLERQGEVSRKPKRVQQARLF